MKKLAQRFCPVSLLKNSIALLPYPQIFFKHRDHAKLLTPCIEYRQDKTKLHVDMVTLVENPNPPTRAQVIEAHDGIARLRAEWDRIASNYDIIITPSAVDEAPEGLESTGTAVRVQHLTLDPQTPTYRSYGLIVHS